jgi:hypothetical protein
MNNAIESLLRDHVSMCRDLIAEREPQVHLTTLGRHWKVLADRFGHNGVVRIGARAQALVREIFGGAPAPALANARIDPWYVVEADILAERLAAEYRAAGDRPSSDPAWRDKLNTRYATLLDRHRERLEQRAQPNAPAPAPEPPTPKLADVRAYMAALLEFEIAMAARWQSLVPVSDVAKLGAIAFGPGDEKYRLAVEHIVRYAAAAALELPLAPNPVRDLEVDRDLTLETATAMRTYAEAMAAAIVKRETKAQNGNGARSAEHRHGIAVTGYCGVWEPGAIYGTGTMVTDRGTLWFAQAESTSARPGASPDWKMMVKTKERA